MTDTGNPNYPRQRDGQLGGPRVDNDPALNDADRKNRAEEKVSASVVYNPGPQDPVETTWGGKRFVKGQAVTINDPHMIEAAKGNHAFNVDGEDKAADRQKLRDEDAKNAEAGREASMKADEEAMEARHEAESNDLEAKHQAERDRMLNSHSVAKGEPAVAKPTAALRAQDRAVDDARANQRPV